ncbi:hypothetical protein [uncultured Capnocytophaga sp.]|uniref:hypothetical protein n=1 Tax=uncultured Capnocytophaga sp. TaxID=159273 RepID=UPI0026222E7E|nr:hypothetical protein [uncultured Capnocytophaga sp.]
MNQSYFKQSFYILCLATLIFVGLKPYLPTRIFPEGTSSTNIVVDSLMLEALAGKDIEEVLDNKPHDSLATSDTSTPSGRKVKTSSKEEGDNLSPFFKKLQNLERTGEGHIRIGYFGDSMTDGDFIVQDLRALFQTNFGGNGIGFLPITSESAASRGSVRHTYSNNWKRESYVNVKRPTRPFGVAGQVFFVRGNPAWVEYRASQQAHISQMYAPTLFYGKSGNSEAYVEIRYPGDTARVVKPLKANKLLNTITLSEGNVKGVRLNFIKADSIPIYGINSANMSGVHVDNFSSRGNSGLPLSLFNTALMRDFDTALGTYDLIVLHFGANVLNYGSLDYSWYKKGMTKVVEQLRTCFPKASFLIVSTADKSSKYGTEMKTDTAVVPLSLAQQAYAADTQAGFINLYELMGGEGSMLKWVKANPPLAGKDYTHFNARGTKKVAQLLYRELMKRYLGYKNPKSTPEELEQQIETSKDTLLHRNVIMDFYNDKR